MMAADTRVSFADENGRVVSWTDYKDYRKAIDVNGVLYGFAGLNDYYEELLEELNIGSNDIDVLDFLSQQAKKENHSFIVMRYETDFRIFGHLDNTLYDSTSTALNVEYHGIGSGANSRIYKKHRNNNSPLIPIRKIIETNEKAIKQATKNGASINKEHYATICAQAGGDNGTGGVINMTTAQKTNAIIQEQLTTLRSIGTEAASLGAVAVCSMDESFEKQKLDKLGVQASKNYQNVPNKDQQELHERMIKRMAERKAQSQKVVEARL
ncbi:hypothetical protein GNP85_00035 [Aliivibrio fischeri]|uniref:Uncharacterized protein n=1 Tax=Aliivibrio fischeri TaxID=668 RepID=A0A6N3Z2U3_ALIFS|nr:hypothetical protein [Aliivibrio fischeri]MUK47568.1 hypothetical protein [Aliivibrio fischeri]MUK82986.1 hypothetical protein [Aliivibrio fischeri]